MRKNPQIVVIGGGTGTFVVLSGLKKYYSDLVAIVSMADSGGCNRMIRDELGLLPTSDIRQCFVALASGSSETERIMRDLFTYRFTKGNGLTGMTFGNLFMAALSGILGSQKKAIEKTGQVLRINGKVVPVTLNDVDLVAKYENGEITKGEHYIDEPPSKHNSKLAIADFWLEPKAKANKDALDEIKKADLIIMGPGDLYTSVLANCLVKGIPPAIKKSEAKLVYVVNLMTKYGQTYDYSAKKHVEEFKKYTGRWPDFVLINSKKVPPQIERKYRREEKSTPVKDNLENKNYSVIRKDFLSSVVHKKSKADILTRSLIRHNSQKLAKAIVSLLK